MPVALMDAAKSLFGKFGFDATSVKMIAERAKANVSLISYYFDGKEGLFRACIQGFGKERLETARRVLKTPKSLEEYKVRLGIFVEEMLFCFVNDAEVLNMLHSRMEIGDEKTLEMFKSTFFESFKTLHDFFSEAKKEKILCDSVDPLILSQILIGALTHFHRTDVINRQFHSVELNNENFRKKIVSQVLNLFTVGAVCKKEKK